MNVCKVCIARFGFKLSEKNKTFTTDEELYDHLENFHGMPVIKEGENEKQAIERCAKKGIVPDRAVCKCEECKKERNEPSLLD